MEIAAICIAMAGVDRPDDRQGLLNILSHVQHVQHVHDATGALLTWALPPDGPVLVNDAVAALVGGTGSRAGIVTIAGTGSIAFGMNEKGEQCRAGGWGYLLGDEGSGYAIGLAGLRAVCRAADGRGPATTLTPQLLGAHGLAQASDLIAQTYGQWGVAEIAACAPVVVAAATGGDRVARDILRIAAEELALATTVVIRDLDFGEDPFDVVTAGGLWTDNPLFVSWFTAGVQQAAPNARVIPPMADAVAGAVLLARESLGLVNLLGANWGSML